MSPISSYPQLYIVLCVGLRPKWKDSVYHLCLKVFALALSYGDSNESNIPESFLTLIMDKESPLDF